MEKVIVKLEPVPMWAWICPKCKTNNLKKTEPIWNSLHWCGNCKRSSFLGREEGEKDE